MRTTNDDGPVYSQPNPLETYGSRSNPVFNGNLHYPLPSDVYKSLNEATDEGYMITVLIIITVPLTLFFFMPAVASTIGHPHCELVRFLFLQTHREIRTSSFSWEKCNTLVVLCMLNS
jgi:hypothetical protein